MPMYYFQLQGPETIADPAGVELSDDAAARAYAITVAREVTFKRDRYLGRDWSEWMMSVTDESGSEVLSLPMKTFADD